MFDEQIKKMYLEDKKSVYEIAEIIGIGRETVRQKLIKMNVYKPNKHIHHNYTNLDFFRKINTEQKAYWLGFIYADGYIGGSYRMSIDLSVTDKNHLQKLSNIFNKPIEYTQTRENIVKLCVYNKNLYNDLVDHGIEENKTYALTTSVLDYVPDNLMHHFIRGYFDGDGTISCSVDMKRNFHFSLIGIKDFISKVQIIMETNIMNLSKVGIYIKNTGIIFILNYGKHDDIISIYNWLYKDATIWLDRKRNKFDEILKFFNEGFELKDRESPPYKGVNSLFGVNMYINGKPNHIGTYKTELEAAYWHDLEQVKQRGEKAKKYMNFPSQYENFIEWIQQGY